MKVKAIRCDECGKVAVESSDVNLITEMFSFNVNGYDYDFCSITCANVSLACYGVTLSKI